MKDRPAQLSKCQFNFIILFCILAFESCNKFQPKKNINSFNNSCIDQILNPINNQEYIENCSLEIKKINYEQNPSIIEKFLIHSDLVGNTIVQNSILRSCDSLLRMDKIELVHSHYLRGRYYIVQQNYPKAKSAFLIEFERTNQNIPKRKDRLKRITKMLCAYELGKLYRNHDARTDSSFYYFDFVNREQGNFSNQFLPKFSYHYSENLFHKRDFVNGLVQINEAIRGLKDSYELDKLYTSNCFRVRSMHLRKNSRSLEAWDNIKISEQYLKVSDTLEMQKTLTEAILVSIYLSDSTKFFAIADRIQKYYRTRKMHYANLDRLEGYFWFNVGGYEKSISFYENFLSYALSDNKINSQWVDEAYFVLAEMYELLGNPLKAYKYQQKNYFYVSNMKLDGNWKDFISDDKANQAGHPRIIHYGKAGQYLYSVFEKTRNIEYLEKAMILFTKMDSLLFQNLPVTNDEGILSFISFNHECSSSAISTSYELFQIKNDSSYLDWMLKFMDRSKAFVLNRNIGLKNLNSSSNKHEIITYTRLLMQIRKAQASNNVDIIEGRTYREAERLNIKISEDLPEEYFRINYQSIPSLRDLQEKLNTHEAIINFNIVSSEMRAILILKDNIFFHSALLSDDFIKSWKMINIALSTDEKISATDYSEHASTLYHILLGPFDSQLKDTEKLIINLDDNIEGIPFEAFSRSFCINADFNELDYALLDWDIEYIRSLKNYHRSQNHVPNVNNGIITAYSLTPLQQNYQNDIEYLNLPYADDEINLLESLNDNTKSTFYKGIIQDRKMFEKNLGSTNDIIHISSHISSSSDTKWDNYFLFQNSTGQLDSIYGYEIASLSIPTQLVVLAGCRSGVGVYQEGEGSLHQSSNWLEAGAQKTICSLWNISDNATYEVIRNFYGELSRTNKSPSSALRQSKLMMLDSHIDFYSNPKYWAGTVCVY